jgi:hypothetical protein
MLGQRVLRDDSPAEGETLKKFFNPGFIKNVATLAFLLTNIRR